MGSGDIVDLMMRVATVREQVLDIAAAGSVCEPEDHDDEDHVDSLAAESHTILVSDT